MDVEGRVTRNGATEESEYVAKEYTVGRSGGVRNVLGVGNRSSIVIS